MNKLKLIKWVVIGTLLGVPSTLFYLQNADTHVDLVFKLSPEHAWHLGPSGAPLPLLLLATLLLGMLATALPASFLVSRSAARLRGLRKQVASLQDEIDFAKSSPAPKAPKVAPSGEFDDLL